MPVEHQILRCCECSIFQVQQKKKSTQFSCKLCGKKQTLQRVYAQSFQAKDLRPLVQEYNLREGAALEVREEMKRKEPSREIRKQYETAGNPSDRGTAPLAQRESNWERFKYGEESDEDPTETEHSGEDAEVSFEAYSQLTGQKRPRKNTSRKDTPTKRPASKRRASPQQETEDRSPPPPPVRPRILPPTQTPRPPPAPLPHPPKTTGSSWNQFHYQEDSEGSDSD